jgi:hypothetical protein
MSMVHVKPEPFIRLCLIARCLYYFGSLSFILIELPCYIPRLLLPGSIPTLNPDCPSHNSRLQVSSKDIVVKYSKTRLYRTRLDQHFLSVLYEIRYTGHV